MEITSKRKRNGDLLLRTAIAAVVASSFSSGTALAQEEEAAAEGATKLDAIEVTGSRIKRTDVEGALPVTVIDREAIELSGYASAADLIRQLPFNSFGSFRPQSGSSGQGNAEADLRGLGADRTLVLVDGRRLPKSPTTGATQNLNTIPLGAIERIEILSDGASAIYGSDALGGVINVILRKDFTGAELMWGAGSPSIPDNGADRREGSATFGMSTDTTRMLAVASFNSRDIVFERDYPWISPGDGASPYSNNYTTVDGGLNWTLLPGACEPDTGRTEGTFYELESPTSLTGTRCGYDFTRVNAEDASSNNESIFARGDHQFAPNWTVFADFWYSKADSFGRYAPVPDSPSPLAGGSGKPLSGTSPNNPTNPASPLYDPNSGLPDNTPVFWWHRFDALGNRDDEVENTLVDVNGGFRGLIGGFDVEVGYRNTSNKTTTIGRNYLLRTVAEAFIEDGTYNLADPTSAPDEVLSAMKVTISRISTYDQQEAYASAGWDMFAVGGRSVRWAAGAEYREDEYSDLYDSLSEANSVGGSAGNSAGGGRHSSAVFLETLVPVLDNLEVSLAGRYDDYSDYGNDFSPKISARWQPLSEVTFRASYGEGFRAPTLDILTQKDSFSADSVNDAQSCANAGEPPDCDIQINGLRTANPSLGSETSEQLSIGVAFAPTSWLNGTLDYWDTTIEDRILFFSAQELVDREEAGDPVPAGLGVERDASGSITRIVQGFGNEGTIDISGIDLSLQATAQTGFGIFDSTLLVSYVLELTEDGGRDQVSDPGQPEYRATWANTYKVSDFVFGWNINVIDGTADSVTDGAQEGHVPTWVTHDLQATYNTPWNGRVTLGALNAFEKEPPIGLGFTDGRAYDFRLYNGDGRVAYVRYTQSF